jgi:hypothetical protein
MEMLVGTIRCSQAGLVYPVGQMHLPSSQVAPLAHNVDSHLSLQPMVTRKARNKNSAFFFMNQVAFCGFSLSGAKDFLYPE